MPHQVIGEIAWFREEILERRPFDFLHLITAAKARIEIFLKEGTEINFFEGIFLLFGGDRRRFLRRSLPVAVFFPPVHIINKRDRILQFLQNRIFHHFGGDHVLEFKLVERKHADHLHQTRSKDLSLRDFQVQFGLQ